MKRRVFLLFAATGWCFSVKSQEVIASSGAYLTNSSVNLQYCLGETVIFNGQANNTALTQGFIQPYVEIISSTFLMEKNRLSVYPNPTIDAVILSIGELKDGYSYTLWGSDGTLLQENTIETILTNISLASLPSATYHLRVAGKGKEFAEYRIIKN